jgi:hypothetical protein
MNTYQLFFAPLITNHPLVSVLQLQAPSALEELNTYLYYSVLLALVPTFAPSDHQQLLTQLAERSEEKFKTWYNTLTSEQQNFIKETIERSLLSFKLV